MFRTGRAIRVWTGTGLALYWLVLMHLPIANYGGWGTDLPLNLLSWGALGIIITGGWLLMPVTQLRTSCIFWLWLGGAVLMSLPLIWSPSAVARLNALPRIAGMWGGILLYFTLLQLQGNLRMMRLILVLLAAAGMIECIWVLVELYLPSSWLPPTMQGLVTHYGRYGAGSFQQANVTSSFIALSLGCMLLLTGLKSAPLSWHRMECFFQSALAVGMVLTTVVLVLLKSRTGWLGGLSMVVFITILFTSKRFRHEGCRRVRLIFFPVVGLCVGVMLLNVSILQALHQHDGSNHQRWLTLVQTMRMSELHPFLGLGAGTFQAAYQNFVAELPFGNPGREMMNYPHNELLYQYSEGGIPALTGVLLWIVAGFLLWKRSELAIQRGMLLCIIPVLLHMQLEYPLYYSVAHWFAIVLLAVLAESRECKESIPTLPLLSKLNVKRLQVVIGRIVFIASGIYVSSVSLNAFNVGQTLGRFENNSLTSPEEIATLDIPWVMRLRADHDMALLWLVRFHDIPDVDYLERFIIGNQRWLSINADDNMYRNQIAVLRYLHRYEEAKALQKKAQRMFPWEASEF